MASIIDGKGIAAAVRERVARDVEEGFVSEAAARELYAWRP